jgi:pimeloyl-ACP methyl ester carboxylesterase
MAKTPLVLLHGFYHGAWCWTDVVLELAAAGRAAVPVDMAGHGLKARRPRAATTRPFDDAAFATEKSPVADIDLAAAASLLIDQVRTIGRGEPLTVVAHSMGGAVLTRAAEEAPELIARLVYLAAYMPASGTPCLAYVSLPEAESTLFMPLLCGDAAVTGALRIDPLTSDPAQRERLLQAFYGDVERPAAEAAMALLGCDAAMNLATEATTLSARRWGALPRHYIECTQDRTIPLPLQRLFVRQANDAYADNPTRVDTLEAAHAPFLSTPARLAQLLAALP